MFWNSCLLYRGKSVERYNEIRNILKLNNIKYKVKIKNKNSNIGPMMDKMFIGTLGQREDFSNEYIIYINKENYDYANHLVTSI